MEGKKVREEDRGHIGLTKKEIYETIGVCLDTDENNDSHEIGCKEGEVSMEIQ